MTQIGRRNQTWASILTKYMLESKKQSDLLYPVSNEIKLRDRGNITIWRKWVIRNLLNIIHLFFIATLPLNRTLVFLVLLNNSEISDICHLHLKCQCKQEDDITRTPLGFCYKVTSCHFIQILFLCKGIGMWMINCRLRTRIICSLFRKKQQNERKENQDILYNNCF